MSGAQALLIGSGAVVGLGVFLLLRAAVVVEQPRLADELVRPQAEQVDRTVVPRATLDACTKYPWARAEASGPHGVHADGTPRVVVKFGFMETPDVPLALMRSCDQEGIHFDPMETTYFASRETIVATANRGMPIWRDKLFALMHRNAAPATGFFRIPGNRLVELGAQVEI